MNGIRVIDNEYVYLGFWFKRDLGLFFFLGGKELGGSYVYFLDLYYIVFGRCYVFVVIMFCGFGFKRV